MFWELIPFIYSGDTASPSAGLCQVRALALGPGGSAAQVTRAEAGTGYLSRWQRREEPEGKDHMGPGSAQGSHPKGIALKFRRKKVAKQGVQI